MPTDATPNLGLALIEDNARGWGDKFRANMVKIDEAVGAMQVASGQVLLDYGSRTDGAPLYLGKAIPGVAQGAPAWTITRFEYASEADGAALAGTQVRTGSAWSNRANPNPIWES